MSRCADTVRLPEKVFFSWSCFSIKVIDCDKYRRIRYGVSSDGGLPVVVRDVLVHRENNPGLDRPTKRPLT